MKIKIFFGIIITIFLFHFTMTAIYVLPFNPIKNKINDFVVAYMEPLFTQNWMLFAPNPLSNNYYVNIQVKDKSKKQSKWMDISTPLYDANHSNRFSPVNKLVRIGTSTYMQAIQSDELFDKIEQKKIEVNHQQQINKNKEISSHQKDGIQQLYNFGYYFAEKQFEKQEIHEIRIRVLSEKPIPFSKRNDKDYKPEKSYITYGWEPVQGGVVGVR